MAERTSASVPCIGLLLAGLLLSGCAQLVGGKTEIRQKRRYTVAVEPIRDTFAESLRPYPVTVQLRPFDIAAHYNQLEIVTRSSPYELRRERLHVWGLRPREMLTQVVAEYLRGSQLFARVLTDRDVLDHRPDYTIGGSIRALERIDSGNRWFARLRLSMQLVRQQDGTVIWRGEILETDDIEVYDSGMQYTVQALSEILRRKMEQFVRELDELFRRMALSSGGVEMAGAPPDSAAGAPLAEVRADTAAASLPDYYEIIPGKLAP